MAAIYPVGCVGKCSVRVQKRMWRARRRAHVVYTLCTHVHARMLSVSGRSIGAHVGARDTLATHTLPSAMIVEASGAVLTERH